MASKLKIIPLGGLGEIGKNLTIYEYGKDMFLVDCGMGFPDQDLYGVDMVIPDISYLKANAAQVLADLEERREPLVITQNGEARAVLQDVASFEETQQTLALLKILALGTQDVEAGRVKPAAQVLARLRAKHTGG